MSSKFSARSSGAANHWTARRLLVNRPYLNYFVRSARPQLKLSGGRFHGRRDARSTGATAINGRSGL